MSNKYGSQIRTIIARNLAVKTLSPPADLVLQKADWEYLQPFQTGARVTENMASANPWDVDTNILLKRVGIFSNFADGLVFKNAAPRLYAIIKAYAATRDFLTGDSVTFTAGSKTLTGVGTTFTSLNTVTDVLGVVDFQLFGIHEIVSDTEITLSDFAAFDATYLLPSLVVFELDGLTAQEVTLPFVSVMNTMFETGKFFTPASLFTSADQTDLIMTCRIANDIDGWNFIGTEDLTFLTKSISTDFDGDTVFFDCYAEIETTPYVTV